MRRLWSLALCLALGVAWCGVSPALARRRPAPSPSPTPTASPTAMPTPTRPPEDVRLARLQTRLDAIAAAAPGTLGVEVLDPARGTRLAVRGDRLFPLASVFKLAVAVAVLRRADEHKLDLDQRVLVTAADLRRGASPIAEEHPRGNVTYAYWELVRAMIARSDNTACDVLLRTVGGPAAVQALMDRLGIKGFSIRKSEADMAADERSRRTFAHGGDNGGSPAAVADLLDAIVTERALFLDTTNELLEDLALTDTARGRLRAGFPPERAFAHKSGTSDDIDGMTDATNDAGVVTYPDGRRVIVVALLAASRADPATRDATLADVARAVDEAYMP